MLEPVACLGTFSVIDLWRVDEPIIEGQVHSGSKRNTVIGNDAVIVAKLLTEIAIDTRCVLLAPTRSDLESAREWLGTDRVESNTMSEGEITRSLCLERDGGGRSWVFNRIPSPTEPILNLPEKTAYVDYYPEVRSFLDTQLTPLVASGLSVFLNLSDLAGYGGAVPDIEWQPWVTQASGEGLSESQAFEAVRWMVDGLGSELAIVTLGARGVLVASDTERNRVHALEEIDEGRSILGAGAVFSACLIAQLLADRPVNRAGMEAVMVRTTSHLPPPVP